jgi:hypothetical protein
MPRTAATATLPRLLFPAAALSIVTVCMLILRTQRFAMNPDVGAWGVTFDLTITIPLVYYLTVVRSGAAKAITLAPLFVVCMAVAARIVPHGHQDFLMQLRWLAAPLEIVTLALVGARLLRMRGAREAGSEPLERIAAACKAVFGDNAAATFVAFEITTLYYGLFTWRKPAPAEGTSVHERSGWGAIVAVLLFVIAAEGTGMHFLLGRWFPRGTWLWTALDLYGALWLLGDYQALRLRRTTLEGDMLHVRFGLRATADVPLSSIASIDNVTGDRMTNESDRKGRRILKVAIADEPRFVISLREPMTIQWIAGLRKTIDGIAILPDDDGFEASLRRAAAGPDASSESAS